MSNSLADSRRERRRLAVDLLIILMISLLGQATRFSYQQGRAVISGDSAQYVASAEALLDGGKTPHFEMRKPGYILYLAGVSWLVGNMGWATIVGNHLFLALLPIAAYGLGWQLRGRALGWVGALFTVVQLQTVFRGDRMMSEAMFTCLLSFAILLGVIGLTPLRQASRRINMPMLLAGWLFGAAWLTRGTATPIIGAMILVVAFLFRRDLKRLTATLGCLLIPIVAFVVLECGLNRVYSGQFRPTNGTAGATLLLRARNFHGLDWPKSDEAKRVIALVPQRDPGDAYVANLVDAWVARYHAVHDQGMNEWDYDGLMGRVGFDALRPHVGMYLTSSLRMTLAHLLRQADGQALSPIPAERLAGPLIHPAAPNADEGERYWFTYWGLPHLTLDESISLVDRMKHAASQRAPFGDERAWQTLRYWKTKPVIAGALAAVVWLGSLWPGFALLGFHWLGLNRRVCAALTVAYVCDAVFIGFITPTTARLQFSWIAIDTVLAASLSYAAVGAVARCARWLRIASRTRGLAQPGNGGRLPVGRS